MNRTLCPLLVCVAMWPLSGLADTLDLPERPGAFWLRLDALPDHAPRESPTAVLRFNSLAELTEHALTARPESRAAWLGLRAEAARLDAASAERWPTLTAQIFFNRTRSLSSAGASVPTLQRYGPSLGLAWTLYDFGARDAGIEAQRFQVIAALLGNDRVLQDTIAEVEAAWFALAGARALEAAQAVQEAAFDSSLAAVALRVRSGLASRADRLRAQAALAEASLARQAAVRDRAKAEAALKAAAGIAQTQPVAFDWDAAAPDTRDAPALLADLLAEAERRRPDLRALEAAAASARADAERARAARLPVVALSASAGRTFFVEDERSPSSTYGVGVNVAVPLFDGGRLAAEARAAERDAARLEAEIEIQRNQIARAVADAYHDARHAQARREGVAIQFESASESAVAAEARYVAGVGTLLEWLTAQSDLARARQVRAQAESEWLAAFSRLNHALGRLPATLTTSAP